jgi:hypothetical protein
MAHNEKTDFSTPAQVECELIETLLVHNFIDVCRHRYILYIYYDIRVPCVKEHDRRVHHQSSRRTCLRWAARSTCMRASRDRFALVRHGDGVGHQYVLRLIRGRVLGTPAGRPICTRH